MRRLLSLAAVVLCSGCASTGFTLSGVAVGHQQVTMTRGVVEVQSAWTNSTVSVRAAQADFQDRLGFWVTAENRSGRPADLGTESVALSLDGRLWIPVESYEQIKSRLDNKAMWAKIGSALVGGLEAGLAGQAGRRDVYGSYHSRFGTSTYHGTYYDRGEQVAALSAAAARTQMRSDAINAQHDTAVAALDEVALRTTTVMPSEQFGGLVVASLPELDKNKTTPVLVRVSFLGEDHVFQFQAHKPGAFAQVAVDPAVLADEASNGLDPLRPFAAQASGSPVASSPTSDARPMRFQRFDTFLAKQGVKDDD